MSLIPAKLSVALVSTALFCSACTIETGGSRSGIHPKDYQCQELKDLIDEQEKLFLRGVLGSSSLVFASADSCHSIIETPLASSWKTRDVFSCVVGYRCLNKSSFGNDF